MKKSLFIGVAALASVGLGLAVAQTINVQKVLTIGPADLFQDIVGGVPQAQSVYATAATLTAYQHGQPSIVNAGIVAGDAGQNLWQRGTAGTSTTSATVAWDSADHWGQWTLSSGGVKIVKDTTAADLPTGYSAAYGLTHTAATAGAICMGQPIDSANSYQFAGQTVELDFHAATSASYTGTNTFTAYITYGTGTDEGLNKMAFTVNAGGATGWAGGANATVAVVPLTAVSTIGRFAAVATIPATATEVGVAFCYTPTTADTTDYVAITGVQLVRSPQLAAKVSTTVAYDVQTNPVPFSATSFIRNDAGLEAQRQYRYYYQITESSTSAIVRGSCVSSTTSISNCFIPFPIVMRIVPTMTYATGFLASAQSASTSGFACTGIITSATVTGFGPSASGVLIDCQSSAAGPAAGTAGFFWDAGTGSPTGAIKASAEL